MERMRRGDAESPMVIVLLSHIFSLSSSSLTSHLIHPIMPGRIKQVEDRKAGVLQLYSEPRNFPPVIPPYPSTATSTQLQEDSNTRYLPVQWFDMNMGWNLLSQRCAQCRAWITVIPSGHYVTQDELNETVRALYGPSALPSPRPPRCTVCQVAKSNSRGMFPASCKFCVWLDAPTCPAHAAKVRGRHLYGSLGVPSFHPGGVLI